MYVGVQATEYQYIET